MKLKKNISFYIILFILFSILLSVLTTASGGAQLNYSDFIVLLNSGQIKEVVLKDGRADIKLVEPFEDNRLLYYMNYDSSESIENLLAEYKQKEIEEGKLPGLTYKVERPSSVTVFIIQLIPYLLIIGAFIFVWFFVLNQAQSTSNKAMSFGKSRARLSTESRNKVTFKDVAGAKEEKQELEELVLFLKDPTRYSFLGARIPKGVLLVGPPGTGKTLLAKAVAGEAGVPFFTISGSDFVEMYVGVGASRVRDLFNQAKKNSPCIVFIDEIDAVGRHRGAGLGGGHDEREQTLNQLLVEMDGFQANEGVIIMAATNRPDILDPALLRPGRFDRQVYVNLPDVREREEILKVHSRNKPLNDDVDLSEIAKTTPGFSGAELENLLNEAALIAARKNKKRIEMEDVKESTFKVIMGPEKKSRVMTEKDKRLTAYHEAGHALAVKYVSTTDKVDRISIIPAGRAGGYTSFRPDEDLTYTTRTQLLERIIISLAGKAAEEIVFGDCSTGATSDLVSANKIARNMVTRLGMSSKIGNMILGGESDEVFIGKDMAHTKSYSEEFSAQVDREVKAIIDDCDRKVREMLIEHMDALHAVSDALLEKERLEGHEFEELLQELSNKKQGVKTEQSEENKPLEENKLLEQADEKNQDETEK